MTRADEPRTDEVHADQAQSAETLPDSEAMTWVDAEGAPIAGMTIQMNRTLQPQIRYVTDAKGRSHRVFGTSFHDLVLTHPSFTFELSEYGDLMTGSSTAKLPVFLKKGHKDIIAGKVLDATGKPVADALVRVAGIQVDSGENGFSSKWLRVRADGSFEFAVPGFAQNPDPASNLLAFVDIRSASITGPVPARVRIIPGASEPIRLTSPPRRKVVLLEGDGGPVLERAWASIFEMGELTYIPKQNASWMDQARTRLESMNNVPLRSGIYTLEWAGRQYGPTTLDEKQDGDLVLKAPPPIKATLTVVDWVTSKPSAGKTVVVSTQIMDTAYFNYLTPEQWSLVMATRGPEDFRYLNEQIANWFQNLGRNFFIGKTDMEGHVTVNLIQDRPDSRFVGLVLGPDDYPFRAELDLRRPGAKLYRIPSAVLRVAPWVPSGHSPHQSGDLVATYKLTRDPRDPKDESGSYYLNPLQVSNVESGVNNRMIAPAGVPMTVTFQSQDSHSYTTDLITLAPGQTLDLGNVSMGLQIRCRLSFVDRQGSTLDIPAAQLATVCVKGSDGKWTTLRTEEKYNETYFLFSKTGSFTVGLPWPGQGKDEEPAYQAKIEIKEGTNQWANAKVDTDVYAEYRPRREIANVSQIRFQDALGNPMPEGTRLIPAGREADPAAGATLDAKGAITGTNLAKIYTNNMIISHPDYGRAIMLNPWGNQLRWEQPLVLPLAPKAVNDPVFSAIGKVVDPEGKPLANMRVMTASSAITSAWAYYSLREANIVGLTNADGTFRIHAIIAGANPDRMTRARAATEPNNLVAFSDDPWIYGWQGKNKPAPALGDTPGQTLTVLRAVKEFTVVGVDENGKDYTFNNRQGTFKPVGGGEEFFLTQQFMPRSNLRPLAYGTYQFQTGYEPFTIDDKTPPKIVVKKIVSRPVHVAGTVTDWATGKPVPGALVMGTDWISLVVEQMGVPSDEDMSHVASLTNPVTVKRDIPFQIVSNVGARTAGVTDPAGNFNIFKAPDAPNINSSGHVSLYLLAKGYVPMTSWFETARLKLENDIYPVGGIKMMPAATVTIESELSPEDHVAGQDAPRYNVVYQFPESIKQMQKNEGNVDLPYSAKFGKMTGLLPADVPIRVFFEAYSEPDAHGGFKAVPMWEQPGEPRTFKPGEVGTLKLTRVEQVPVKIRLLDPDGRPVVGAGLTRLLALDPDVPSPWRRATDDKGEITLLAPAGRTAVFALTDLSPNRKRAHFEIEVAKTAPTDVAVIRLTPTQWKEEARNAR